MNEQVQEILEQFGIKDEVKTLELFGGIGAVRKALIRQNIPHKVVDYVEIDEFAVKSYNAVYGTNFEPQDISKWDKDIDIDFIMHGSPCQDFSIAGLQKGGDEGSGTRSSLMYETLRIVKKLNPQLVIWENVKNLISDKHYHNFRKYLNIMDEFGYNNYHQVLNAKDYGIPQNRERIFTVSIRKDIDHKQFYFPEKQPLNLRLKDLLETNVDEKYYLSDDKINAISHWKSYQNPLERVMGNNSVASTLTAREGGTDHAGMLTYSDELDDTTNIQEQLEGVKRLGGLYDNVNRSRQSGAIYDKKGLAPTLSTGHGLDRPFIIDDNEKPNKILKETITQIVKVRKYPVDTERLVNVLKEYKDKANLSYNAIAESLSIPVTQVEHYFKTDDSFAIPDPDIWLSLKELLQIDTDEFDESLLTFEEKECSYDMSNRAYYIDGIAPTLDTKGDKKIIEYKGKEVELPAGCASRGRNLDNPNDRTPGQKLQQTLEVNTEGTSNCLTTFEKDNYVLEPDNREPKLEYVGSIKDKDIVGDGKQNLSRNASVGDRVYDSNGVSTTITAEGGGVGGHSGLYTVDDTVKVVGNYMPSGYESGRILDTTGIAPTVKENHGSVYAIVEENQDIDNPLKGISGQSWQFEQNVYSEDSKCIRTLKAGEGSGNIPKIIENDKTVKQQIADEINKNAQHQQDLVQTEDDEYARTLVAGTHGNASSYTKTIVSDDTNKIIECNPNAKHQHELVQDENGISRCVLATPHATTGDHLKTMVREQADKNMKEQLCDYLVQNDLVEPYDVINHGYTDHRFETLNQGKDLVMSKNMAPTITTRPDELGVAVETNKSVFTESDKQMITEDGNVKRYINSNIVDEFIEGQIADISFPNGYNKGPRVHNECPTINGTTVQSFITKESQGTIIGSGREHAYTNNEGIAPTLTSGMGTGGGNVPMHNIGLRIRKLTPKECWRLMGFDDEDFEKAAQVNSNAQLYKQAGNSIVVNVLEAILNSVFKPNKDLPKRKYSKKLF